MMDHTMLSRMSQVYPLISSPDGSSGLDYVVHQDVTDQRMRLFYRLPLETEIPSYQILGQMLMFLKNMPLIPLHQLAGNHKAPSIKLRYSSGHHPTNCLEQTLFIIQTSDLSPQESNIISLLHEIYPKHYVYQQMEKDVDQNDHSIAPLPGADLTLNYAEQVDSYYKMLHKFVPSVAHYLPVFDEFSINSQRFSHIIQRNNRKPTGVLWSEMTLNTMIIRVIFSLSQGHHVLTPLLEKAYAYAKQRNRSKLLLFFNVHTQEQLALRYMQHGFKLTNQYLHYFLF